MNTTEKVLWLFSAIQAAAVIFLLCERISFARAIGHVSKWMEAQGEINDTVGKDLARINKHIFK